MHTKTSFTKQATTVTQQLELLKERGLVINNESHARHCLSTVSYYRLSAYFKPFEQNKHKHHFKVGTDFEAIWELYVFDRELRLLLLDALERIEIALRAALGNAMAVKYGPLWYLDDQLFKAKWQSHKKGIRKTPQATFLNELKAICNDAQKRDFIKHYYQKYHSPAYPPSWMILESLSFGSCTSLFRNIHSNRDRADISHVFELHPYVLESILEPIRYTRNLCAHHERLWDRWFIYEPRKLKELEHRECQPRRLKVQLVLIDLLMKPIAPHSHWKNRLKQLFDTYQNVINFELMGFKYQWREDPFWQ